MKKLARIPADVSKRLLLLACAAALLTAACSKIPEGEVVSGQGTRFVVSVADSIDDVGLGNAVTVDKDGNPFYSYLILPAKLAPGEVPAQRPIGAPYIQTESTEDKDGKFGAAIGVGSVTPDGIFTRGAAAQVRDSPAGVAVPYGPATVESLVGATADSMNGTDIAIDPAGTKHVVWTGPDGVWYAEGSQSFTAAKVYDYGFALRKAGPIGRPSVTVDADGNPWVAYSVDAKGRRVEAATPKGDAWSTEVVARIATCSGCPPPGRTEIGVTDAGLTVAYVDPAAKSIMVATRGTDGTWTSAPVATGVEATGLAMAVGKDGAASITYYDADGAVQLATQDGAGQDGNGWSVTEVAAADLGDEADGIGNLAPTTGVAVDDQGVTYVTFVDAGSVKLVSSEDGETFTPIETGDTSEGRYPSVAAAADGSAVYVTWYDEEGQLLKLGIQADIQDLQVAAPSPTTEVAPPQPGGECGTGGKTLLDIDAQTGNVFDTNCLVAPAGDKFTINFTNSDTATTHNIDVFTEQGGDSLATVEPKIGPIEEKVPVDALDAGDYYFQCDVHPTTMFGTLAVVAAKGK